MLLEAPASRFKPGTMTNNQTIKKAPRKGNGGPHKKQTEGPVTGTRPLLISGKQSQKAKGGEGEGMRKHFFIRRFSSRREKAFEEAPGNLPRTHFLSKKVSEPSRLLCSGQTSVVQTSVLEFLQCPPRSDFCTDFAT